MISCMSPKVRRISVTEAARNFADIVNRAYYRNETTVLLKNGVAVAHIAPAAAIGIPARELLARWQTTPRLGRDEAEAMARDIEAGRAALPPLRSPWD
jgi:antitoxin (DNA-binding transcriptional repressor) of toxin-antitoxin stability system